MLADLYAPDVTPLDLRRVRSALNRVVEEDVAALFLQNDTHR